MSDQDQNGEAAPVADAAPADQFPPPIARPQIIQHWLEPIPAQIPPMGRWRLRIFDFWLAVSELCLERGLRTASPFWVGCGKFCLRRAFHQQRGLLPMAKSDAFYKIDL